MQEENATVVVIPWPSGPCFTKLAELPGCKWPISAHAYDNGLEHRQQPSQLPSLNHLPPEFVAPGVRHSWEFGTTGHVNAAGYASDWKCPLALSKHQNHHNGWESSHPEMRPLGTPEVRFPVGYALQPDEPLVPRHSAALPAGWGSERCEISTEQSPTINNNQPTNLPI